MLKTCDVWGLSDTEDMSKNRDRRYENKRERRRKYYGKSMGVRRKEPFPEMKNQKRKNQLLEVVGCRESQFAGSRNGLSRENPIKRVLTGGAS
jgi:hypothetical protein